MKSTKKLISALIAVIMILSLFASCGDPLEDNSTDDGITSENTTAAPSATGSGVESTPESSENTETSESTEETAESTPEESTTFIDLESLLPPEINLDKDMSVLVQMLYYDEWLDKDNGDIVGTELYNRPVRVEDRLGIELNIEIVPQSNGVEEAIKRQESTDPNVIVQAITTYCPTAGRLVLEGRYRNLASSDNIDFENPWWPDNLVENSMIDDKIYFVSGDISPTLIYETYAIFFNLDLIEKYNIGNPIDMVLNKEWTIDKLIELTSGIYEDLDKSVSGPNMGDFFAFTIADTAHIKAFPFGMGIRVIVPDEESGYAWSELYTGEKMSIICDKIGAWVQNNPGVTASNETGYSDHGDSFKNENTIFHLGNFACAAQVIAGTGIDYGVVPCPLYDGEQEQYYSYYGNPTSFWGVPSNADIDDACLLIEYLAADAYVYISPALFERALKLKYVTGEVDGLSKMFDIIRDGFVFDVCMPYTGKFSVTYNEFVAITTGASSWSNQFDRFAKKSMKSALDSIVTTIRKLEY